MMKKVVLVIIAIALGLAVQVAGAMLDKLVLIPIAPGFGVGAMVLATTVLGFVVMGLLIYRWARG